MKAVMISSSIEQCTEIIKGKRNVFTSKVKPQMPWPFKVYIYMKETRRRSALWEYDTAYLNSKHEIVSGGGRIIGEFVCNGVTLEEDKTYSFDITKLKIYDTPKQLQDFTSSAHCFNIKNVDVTQNCMSEYVLLYHANSFCTSCCKYYNDFGTCGKHFSTVQNPPRPMIYVEDNYDD